MGQFQSNFQSAQQIATQMRAAMGKSSLLSHRNKFYF